MFVTLDSSITKDRLIDYGRIANKVERQLEPELPDISWYNIPKRGNIYQINIKYGKWPQNIPNSHKIGLMAINYTNIFHCKALQIDPNWYFWFENIPSGNPD
jgi:hypothetical protein